MKKLKMIDHYHGKLSKNQHLGKDEEHDVPGEVLTEEAAAELVERNKAVWVATNELSIEPETARAATASKKTVDIMSTGRHR